MKDAFKQLNRNSQNNFAQQQRLIKQVLAGKSCLCGECSQVLSLKLKAEDGFAYVRCAKGCTEIQLDMSRAGK
ncbi:hypothetical protein DBZ36_08625 [Alginatibacterium sediminis]|uniref:Uncharacterized protein n=1 Tax=Alginatibacterium sediminis TaxID=2164068 RepID=A0A420ECP1_9ALTE|nr:hypothetical protein [Alginatibacterium sediminis]RKF18467.1 hypothetical protein DBZ36_08625 [Alginatibacterium sediminis]